MNPVLSIGIYVIMLTITMLQTGWCLNSDIVPVAVRKNRPLHVLVIIIYLLIGLLPVLGAMLPASPVKYRLQGWGNIWLGFYIYFGAILLFLWIPALVLRLKSGNKTHAFRGIALIISIAAALAVWAYGLYHAQNTKVTNLDISIEKEAGGLTDLKLILLGDLHLSVNSKLSSTRKMVELINKENPDLVLIAGDIFTSSYAGLRHPKQFSETLSRIKSRYGVYMVYGNHDVEETLFGGFPISPISQAFRSKEMEQFMDACHFRVLYDENAAIADGSLQVVGRVDGEKAGDGTAKRKSPEEVLRSVDRTKPVLVLQHEPIEFAPLKKEGADLALCGHTHAGQMFPGNLIVPFFNENAYGHRLVGGLDTIVTSGVGYYGPPMRVGTNSEIMVIHLHFK